MQIYGPAQVHGPQSVSAPHNARSTTAPSAEASSSVKDELSISSAAQFVAQAQQLPDIRHDKVAAIRAALADGTYETADKLGTAVDRLLDEIG